MSTLQHRSCTLHYQLRGEGPPVLFVQGIGLHGDGWTGQIDDLSADYCCLSFDNRGMGQSQPVGPGKLSVPLMAEDTLAIADAVGWDTFHLVGHSMGGHIATELALEAPPILDTIWRIHLQWYSRRWAPFANTTPRLGSCSFRGFRP